MDQQKHPDPSSLTRLIAGLEPSPERTHVLRHLLAGCVTCSAELERLASSRPTAVAAEPESRCQIETALERAAQAVRGRASTDSNQMELSYSFARRLLSQPLVRQEMMLRNTPHGRSRALAELLLETSFSLRYEDPRRMVELARLALQVTIDLDERELGGQAVIDLATRASIELANALRVAGEDTAAFRVLTLAFRLTSTQTRSLFLRARLFEVAAKVFRRRRLVGLAARLLKRSCDLYQRIGETQRAGRVMVSWGVLEIQRADPTAGLERLSRASEMLDLSTDRELALSIVHNMLFALVDLERFQAAAEMLEDCRHLYTLEESRLMSLRLRWLEARIAAGLGRPIEAEVKLLEVAHGLRLHGAGYEAAQAQLDLALLLVCQGRNFELERLAQEMVASFTAQGLEQEAVTALLMLTEATKKPLRPAALITRLRRFLIRLPNEKGLRFEA